MAGEAPCVVHEVLRADRGASPLAASLSNLHRALSACPGGAYSGWELTDLMQSVGFIRMQIEPLVPTPCSLVLGYHP